MAAAGCAVLVLGIIPISSRSAGALYGTLFAIVLPVLVASLLAAVWLLRALRDAQLSH
jgi:hypothetical protein